MNRLLLATAIVCATAVGYVGRVDTIGVTSYDWQMCGPQWRTLANAPDFGLHAVWMGSQDTSGGHPDRNMTYNFYDFATRQWSWPGGFGVFSARSGFGSLDVDPRSGVALISSHQGAIRPVVARELSPGSLSFEYCDGAPDLEGYQRPTIAVTQSGSIHLALLDYETQDLLWYSRGTSWCRWTQASQMAAEAPVYDVHSIAASKVSNRVFIGWVYYPSGSDPVEGHVRLSTDDGDTWLPEQLLPAPDVFGGDTAEQFHFSGLFGWFDQLDRLHIAAAIMPSLPDTFLFSPTAICHWCESNSPQWSVVARAAAESLAGSLSYTNALACRPCLGRDRRGNIYVTWEQAHPLNVEPTTRCLRFGIWGAASSDSGRSWTAPVLLTDSNTMSHHYACVSDVQVAGTSRDTVVVSYLVDCQAGSAVMGEGRSTLNPVVCQFVPIDLLGVEAGEQPRVTGTALGPTIVRGVLRLRPSACSSRQDIPLLDAGGRKVLDLKAGNNDVSRLAPGVYFVRKCSSGQAVKWSSEKVIVTQ